MRTPTGMAAALVLAAMLVLAIIGPAIWDGKAAAIQVSAALQGPSAQHFFGTDQIGRDIFARTMAATRLSLVLAVLATLIAVSIGIPVGITQAVLGPRLRRLVAAVISAAVAFPGLLLALFVNTIIGIGATGAVLGIGIAMIPGFARLAQTLSASIAGLDYVAAARTLGVSRARILFRHVLPNIAEPLILTATMAVGSLALYRPEGAPAKAPDEHLIGVCTSVAGIARPTASSRPRDCACATAPASSPRKLRASSGTSTVPMATPTMPSGSSIRRLAK